MRPQFVSLGLLLIAMLSIQFGASVAKSLFPLAGAAGATALRVSMSALILLLVSKSWKHKISGSQLLTVALYGVSLGLMNLTFYFALERIPLGIAVALEFTGPLAVALLLSRRPQDFLWAFLAGLGIYLILPASSSKEALDFSGVLFALAAGFFWGLYILFGKAAGKHGSSLQISSWGMTFAALVTFPFGVLLNWQQMSNPSLWPQGLYIAVLSSALPYSLEMKAMRNLSTKTFGVLMSMEPVVAIVMGFLFLQESLSVIQVGAISCIVVASLGSTISTK